MKHPKEHTYLKFLECENIQKIQKGIASGCHMKSICKINSGTVKFIYTKHFNVKFESLNYLQIVSLKKLFLKCLVTYQNSNNFIELT